MYNSKKSGAKLGLNIRILKLLIFSKLKTEITHTWGAARKVAPRTSSSPRGSPGFVPRRVPPGCRRTSPSAAAGCPGYCYSSCFYARQIFTMFYTTFWAFWGRSNTADANVLTKNLSDGGILCRNTQKNDHSIFRTFLVTAIAHAWRECRKFFLNFHSPIINYSCGLRITFSTEIFSFSCFKKCAHLFIFFWNGTRKCYRISLKYIRSF